MPASETAYAKIEGLVRKFKALSAPARRAYNEDNTRKDFILPLFRALEWDVDNAAEVSAEEKVSRGWVDFAFWLGGTRSSGASSRWTRRLTGGCIRCMG